MLIRNAELHFNVIADVRIEGGVVSAIAPVLPPWPGETVLEANRGALLPGLHDHHLHLVSLAASLESVPCGPPNVGTAEELAGRLTEKAKSLPADGWIRGIGYHDSVAGELDRSWIDRILPHTPVRIQHRSGRLWILNSCALERLRARGPIEDAPLEKVDNCITGRLYDADDWLREKLGARLPSLRDASTLLASFGVTGVTDATPHNGLQQYRHFLSEKENGALSQDVLVMGNAGLAEAPDQNGIRRGATKIHLREADLPSFDSLCDTIRRSHETRPVAFHCVTVTELVFAAGALAACGAQFGDRIEHAALAPPATLPLLADLGVTVVTQPNFIRERGDAYLKELPFDDLPWLYRARGFLDRNVPIAGSTDAPFGRPNPWLAMAAAVDRRSVGSAILGAAEALSPEAALALFMADLRTPGGPPRQVAVGVAADLCILDRPWRQARLDLSAVRIAATVKRGSVVWTQADARWHDDVP